MNTARVETMGDGHDSPTAASNEPIRTRHWSVSVERNGENIVTIESDCLTGRDLLPGDEDVIRDAARNLLGFIGG